MSGGLDSVCVASIVEPDFALFVNYGQLARNAEWSAAKRCAKSLGIPIVAVNIVGFFLTEMNAAPGPGARVTAARNLMLASAGVNAADARGLDEVVFGATRDDHADYPDCRGEFFDALSALSLAAYGVTVTAPALNWSKEQLFKRAPQAPVEHSFSCYSPVVESPCGVCNSCLERNALP